MGHDYLCTAGLRVLYVGVSDVEACGLVEGVNPGVAICLMTRYEIASDG